MVLECLGSVTYYIRLMCESIYVGFSVRAAVFFDLNLLA